MIMIIIPSRMTNRPPNSRWKQQRLPAWQPMLKPTSVFISFIIFGLLCIVIGVIMYITNEKIREHIIDYTDCRRMNPVTGLNQSEYCRDRWKYQWDSCQCLLNFTITEPIDGPLFLYYSLDGFYQNHRRYVASIDHRQLMGEQCSLTSIRSNCYPYSDINGTIIAPCGAIANSMFSDTFQLRRIIVDNKNQYEKIHIWQKDICWPTDRQNLYRNPSNGFDSYAKPVNWSKNFYDDIILNDNNVAGHGYLNEHFMVWMRPAAFPKFRKLWGRIDVRSSIGKNDDDNNNHHDNQFEAGSYQLLIDYDYQTVSEHLRIPKKVIISNMSWMGGKNPFLSILYMIVGVILLLTAIIFLIVFNKIRWKDEMEIQHQLSSTNPQQQQQQQQQPEMKNHFQYYHSTSQ
ncbi:cell cycle control protein 50A [Dermatophagoides farinae]|uniref:cell cycle control protein 50A n=1 Tax=Dermatophagoides farinae TaxID=6954 RepID=UPI003F624279